MSGKKKVILISAAVLLVIVLAVWLVFKYTKAVDKIKDLFNPAFRVEYDGNDYDGDDNIIVLPAKGQVQFKVKGAESYKVTITPNVTPETDFTYEVGDTVYKYSQAVLSKDLTCDNYSLESVLSQLHGGEKVILNGSVKYPYLLTFTADNKTVAFVLSPVPIVRLSESNIFF